MAENTIEVTVSPGLITSPPQSESSNEAPRSLPQDLLLVVFIHGFKGTDSTFGQFPERLRHVLTETIPGLIVESIVFPAYETKGELNAAVIRFADWLTNLTVQREVAYGVSGGAGKAKIVLCGHSMGGLLAADALIEFARTRPDTRAPLWPNIVACIAYDTPYLGLHPHVFKNGATQAAGYVRTAQSLISNLNFGAKAKAAPSVAPQAAPIAAIPAPAAPAQGGGFMWQKWAPAAYAAGGALLAGAAAGAAYYKREELTASYTWATDHMKYVGTLWDEAALKRRVDTLFKIETSMGVLFRNFHSSLPANPPAFKDARTFIILPKPSSSYASHFLPAQNGLASDEISAHTGMFDAKTNDGYYELGLMTAQLLRDVLISIRTAREDVKPNETKGNVPKARSASPKEEAGETAQTESLSTSEKKGASEEEGSLTEEISQGIPAQKQEEVVVEEKLSNEESITTTNGLEDASKDASIV